MPTELIPILIAGAAAGAILLIALGLAGNSPVLADAAKSGAAV